MRNRVRYPEVCSCFIVLDNSIFGKTTQYLTKLAKLGYFRRVWYFSVMLWNYHRCGIFDGVIRHAPREESLHQPIACARRLVYGLHIAWTHGVHF